MATSIVVYVAAMKIASAMKVVRLVNMFCVYRVFPRRGVVTRTRREDCEWVPQRIRGNALNVATVTIKKCGLVANAAVLRIIGNCVGGVD